MVPVTPPPILGWIVRDKIQFYTSKYEHREFFFREKHDDESLANDKSLDAAATKSVLSQGGYLEPSWENKQINSMNKLLNQKQKNLDMDMAKWINEKNKIQRLKLSIISTNAAGLKSKQDSLFNTINKFKSSMINIQETKFQKIGTSKLPDYLTLKKSGGGLLTAVHEDLEPVLVTEEMGDMEILVVAAALGWHSWYF